MIRITKTETILPNVTVFTFEGLSTDTKPIDAFISGGSNFIEIDTGKRYKFDEGNRTWLEFSTGGGGGDVTKAYVDAQDELRIPLTEKGEPNGVATLGTDGKVPVEQLPEIADTQPYSSIIKNAPYSYTLNYNKLISEEEAEEKLKERYIPVSGACSAVRAGRYVGRNFDWKYDEAATFAMRIAKGSHAGAKHASICVGGGIPALTEQAMTDGTADKEWQELLPYLAVDGINDAGVCVSSLVVPAGDMGRTTGTHTDIEKILCQSAIVRYVLDHASSVADVETLLDSVNVWAPSNPDTADLELHFMVADNTSSIMVEFVNNALEIIPLNDMAPKPLATNFYLTGATFDADGVEWASVTDHGQGLERYNLLYSLAPATADEMLSAMQEVKYTGAYTHSNNRITEFCGNTAEYGDLTVTKAFTTPSDFDAVRADAEAEYAARIRDGKTWQTVHSVVYDLDNLMAYFCTQEDFDAWDIFSFDGKILQLLIAELKRLDEEKVNIQQAKANHVFVTDDSGKQILKPRVNKFEQTTASDNWLIEHSLNKYPEVRVIDSDGEEVIGITEFVSLNVVRLKFSAAINGTAYLN